MSVLPFWQVVLGNGLVQLTISNPQGLLTGVKYGGMDNVLDIKSDEYNRGWGTQTKISYMEFTTSETSLILVQTFMVCRYWDINWNLPGEETNTRYKLYKKNDLAAKSYLLSRNNVCFWLKKNILYRVEGAEYRAIQMQNDLVELSFSSTYNPSNPGRGPPLNVDTR